MTGIGLVDQVKLPCLQICRLKMEEGCLQHATPKTRMKCDLTLRDGDSDSLTDWPMPIDPLPNLMIQGVKTEDDSELNPIIMNCASLPILKLHRLRMDQLPFYKIPTKNKKSTRGNILSNVNKPIMKQAIQHSITETHSNNIRANEPQESNDLRSPCEPYITILGLKEKQEEEEVAVGKLQSSDSSLISVKTEASESEMDVYMGSLVADLNADSPHCVIKQEGETYDLHTQDRWKRQSKRQHTQPTVDPEPDWWPRKQKVRRFQCDQCGLKFYTSVQRDFHMRIHTQYHPFSCETCGKTFSRKGGLQEHLPVHGTEQPFICNICDRGFKFKTNLTRHMRFHSDARPYVCELCGQGFKISDNLKGHMRSHSGRPCFFCPECGKGFRRKSSLSQHQWNHREVKPFRCTECGKTFIRSDNLKVHCRIHTKEKPYACKKCGMKFTQSGSMRAHIRKKHS